MKIVSFKDIESLNITPALCYEWVSEMILDKRHSILPAKIHMNMSGNVFCNIMPSIIQIEGHNMGGVKVVTRYPERKPSLDSIILLFNADSGEFLALMDGNWITAMRTGAVAAHSVIHLAKDGWNNVGIIGLGNIARATMLVLASMENRSITVKLFNYKDQAKLFAERFKDFSNLNFQIVDSMEECIKSSDVVISCVTYFENDIALDEWFDEGVLLVPVHTRGFTNCDLFFDKVFADDTSHVDHFKNFSKFRHFGEVSDVLNGRTIGRENNKERILVYNIGVSIHDVNFAAHIYKVFEQKLKVFNHLADIDMHDPLCKFWV